MELKEELEQESGRRICQHICVLKPKLVPKIKHISVFLEFGTGNKSIKPNFIVWNKFVNFETFVSIDPD